MAYNKLYTYFILLPYSFVKQALLREPLLPLNLQVDGNYASYG
jgi:hypothetical protein